MSIPGFTAERSLDAAYQRGGLVHRKRRRVSAGAGVSPALRNIGHACFNLCRGGNAYPGCLDECMAALGG
jgi:hypothetical protein